MIWTALCRPGHSIFCWPSAETLSTVQTITTPETISQGSQPCQAGTFARTSDAGARVMAKAGSGLGFQTARNAVERISDVSEARTSVST